MKTKVILCCITAVTIVAGCTTMNTARLSDPSIRQTLDPLRLRPSFEAYFIREDLVRATHTVTTTSYVNGMMTTSSHEEPNDYSELVL